jgi:hypothetical protein
MRILYVSVTSVVLGYLAFGLYAQHKIAPVMSTPGLELTPSELKLRTIGPVRRISLGYVSFDVPAGLSGSLVRYDETLFVTVGAATGDGASLIIGPPVSDRDQPIQSVTAQFSTLTGEKNPTYLQLRKRMLQTKPFSAWAVPFRGVRRSITDAVLLLMKTSETSRAQALHTFENRDFYVTVVTRPEFVDIRVADKRCDREQNFMIYDRVTDPAEFVATLVASYQFTVSDASEQKMLELLRESGIQQRISKSAGSSESRARRFRTIKSD